MFLDPEVFIGTMIERFVYHAISVSVYIKCSTNVCSSYRAWENLSSWLHCPTFIAKSKLIQVALSLRLEITKKVSRLLHYTGIGWASGKVSGNGGHNRNTSPSHRSHDLYPVPSSVWEKHFFFPSFHSASKNYSYLSYSFGLRHWFKFGVPVVSSPPSFDSSTEVSMVEGMLTLVITLLSTRLHLGNVIIFIFCHNLDRATRPPKPHQTFYSGGTSAVNISHFNF